MRIKCYYRKNLKMSPEKLAAQVSHVCIGLIDYYGNDPHNTVVVLKASDKKFKELRESFDEKGYFVFTQIDDGRTEVETGTETVFGYVEDFV